MSDAGGVERGGRADLDAATARDLAALIADGAWGLVNDWIVDGDEPLDPEQLVDRLLRLSPVIAPGALLSKAKGP
ncbi:hypothetical protein [Streptomyces sp. NPDC058695]|uniref:hypothetical protein n=1 Tax=Streptomyces sp. NPDC058695 TaxID=3346604 RepID=UPI00365EF6CF